MSNEMYQTICKFLYTKIQDTRRSKDPSLSAEADWRASTRYEPDAIVKFGHTLEAVRCKVASQSTSLTRTGHRIALVLVAVLNE